MKNPGIMLLDESEQALECQKHSLPQQENTKTRTNKYPSRIFRYLWILAYVTGAIIGMLLFSLGRDDQFWHLFIRIYQSDLVDKSFNQLLTNQLILQTAQLLFAAFLGHCILGSPLLWLCCIGKAAVHTSVICSLLIERHIHLKELLFSYLTFEFGCGAVYFFVLYLAQMQCRKMVQIHIKNKNQPAAFPAFWEKLLVMLLVSNFWCLACSGIYYFVNQL